MLPPPHTVSSVSGACGSATSVELNVMERAATPRGREACAGGDARGAAGVMLSKFATKVDATM